MEIPDLKTPGKNLRVSSLDSPVPGPGHDGAGEAAEFWPLLEGPPPHRGSALEDERFELLYERLPNLWRNLTANGHVEQTVVVVPSLSLDAEELLKF